METYLHVREDALQLYGFADADERELFAQLLTVSGVGPKVALAALSGGPVRELLKAIATGDAKRFQAVPGIGKRTAERIVVELREKAGVTPDEDDGPIVVRRADDPRTIARDGLLELGFDAREADTLLRDAAGDSAEELLAAALKEARR